MDTNNPVIKLCIKGTQAEFSKDMPAACEFYMQAWQTASNDYEACVAAHYVARCQANPQDVFVWNQKALDHAMQVSDDSVQEFYPSLYLNIGKSFQGTGNPEEAQKYFSLAAALGAEHQEEYTKPHEQGL